MKPFFLILSLAVVLVSCSHPPKQEVAALEYYSKHEVDKKIDSLRQDAKQSFGAVVTSINELSKVVDENGNRFSLYQPSILSLSIPDTFSFCGVELPLHTYAGRENFYEQVYWMYVHQDHLLMYLLRANQWFPDLEHLLREAGKPDDLKYVCVGESKLSSRARSMANARGWWQFIKETGERYDLLVNGHIDMRYSLISSTQGAMNYFDDLLLMFDSSWANALAGYNLGENGLRRRIRDQKTSNYFELDLPYETATYVYRMAAIKYALQNPKLFGIDPDLVNFWEPLVYDTASIHVFYRLTVEDVAEWTHSTSTYIRNLNPEVKISWPQGDYQIKLPYGMREMFLERLYAVQKRINKTGK